MAKNNTTPKSVRCSFCGKAQESVRKIVAGPGVYICDECVDLCTSIIEAELYDDEKDIVLLSVIAGYNSKELGSMLGIKAATVRSKLSRALAKMRKYLE